MRPALRIVVSHRGRPRTDGLRERIRAVAERIFTEHPFHDVRMEDVADGAGVAKGTLYLYFPGKRELYLAVLFESMEQLGVSLERVAPTSAPLERLRGMARCLLEHPWRRRTLLAFLSRHEHHLEPHEARQWLRRRERLSRIVRSAIERAITARELRAVDSRVAEEMLLGIVRGLHARRGHIPSAGRQTAKAMDLFLRGAAADPGRSVELRGRAR